MRSVLAAACSLAVLFVVFSAPTCPPPGFEAAVDNAVADFDLREYASAPWYTQQQMPVSYQPPESLYCVRAVYRLNNTSDPQAGIFVYNSARNGSVTGPETATGGDQRALIAFPATFDPADPFGVARLHVGPRALADRYQQLKSTPAFGPYWVVAFNKDNAVGYKWAIVSGGPPSRPSNGACATNTAPDQGGSGLWLFHRQPVAPAEDVAAMREVAADLGYDLSVLRPVAQQGCIYPALPA